MVRLGKLCYLLCLGLSVSCLACGDNGRLAVYPVKGKLLVDGKPATHAQVAFHRIGGGDSKGLHPVGIVDDKGQFTLTTYKPGDGAPEGQYQVTVTWFLATPNPDRANGDDFITVNYLSDQYARVETSTLRAVVVKGPNQLAPYELESP